VENGVAILWKNYLQLLGKRSCKKQCKNFTGVAAPQKAVCDTIGNRSIKKLSIKYFLERWMTFFIAPRS
jgi:hypothetical protein